MSDILARLAAPFPPNAVSWRVGSTTADKSRGMALAYIDARDVQDRLDEVCGALWQVRHPWAVGGKLACEIGIKIEDEWIWRGDGAGDTDVEAEKGAFSDSFKRAAVRWGIGRYLYDVASPWVQLEARGKTHVIPDREMARLRSSLAPSPAAPSNGKYPDRIADEPRLTLKQIRDRIQLALEKADLPERVDGIIKVHGEDLALIKDASLPTYNNLIILANARKSELRSSA